jgi:Bacteriodetes cell division protein (FtsL-like)
MNKPGNNEVAAPWEDMPDEPQRITAKEASAAAARTGDLKARTGNPAARTGNPTARTGNPAARTGNYENPGSDAAEATSGTRTPGTKTATRTRWQPSQMGYRWVVRNVGFLLFLTALAVIYIYNGHYADKISRDLNKTNKELKELQYEYKTLKSEVMFRSKESELAKAVEPFGLKELTRPPFVIIDSVRR